MNLSPIRDNFKKFGIAAGLHDVTKKAVNKVVPVRVLCAMKLTFDRVDPEFLSLPAGYAGAFATPEQLRAWQGDARLDLDDAFLRDAATRGDLCYAITWGSDLVSYGWYSKRPTSIADDLVLHFDEAWVYMFKGLTLPEYRGNRLHAIGMARALEAYEREGSNGILSYVESNNFASLRSCYRMGYQDIGIIMVSRVRGRALTLETPGCRPYGLWVEAR